MRRDQQSQIMSSRNLKLHLKSPPLRSNKKINSPIQSHRPLSKKKRNSNTKKNNTNLIWVPNPTLYSFFDAVHKLQAFQESYELKLRVDDRSLEKRAELGQKIWIISAIDTFVEIYMELTDQIKLECQKWFIISNAVNSKEMEDQFNQLYSPIQFYFLPSISSVLNTLLKYNGQQLSSPLRSIYDLSLVCSSDNLCAQETLLQKITSIEPECLYIISDTKQWLQFSAMINNSLIPYFINGNEQLTKQGLIIVKQSLNKNVKIHGNRIKMMYICFSFEKNIKNIKGFTEFQQQFKHKLQDPAKLSKLNLKNQMYIRKIISKLLVPKHRVCLFAEPIPKSPLFDSSELYQKMPPEYFLFGIELFIIGPYCCKLKYNCRTRSSDIVCISTTSPLADQIAKIQQYMDAKNSVYQLFKKNEQILKKINIILYCKDTNYRHCITQSLDRWNIKTTTIQDLGYIVQVQKITIVYGYFTFAEVKALSKFYNVFLVPVSKQPEDLACFNQIVQAKCFIDKVLKSYEQLCSEPISPTQVLIHVLYEQQTQLPALVSCLQIPQHQLKTHYIATLHTQLPNFRQNSKHILISPMDIFSESLEAQVREFQWRLSTISIQVYLQYGNQFIFRNKQGNYKFIKAAELKAKIRSSAEVGKIQVQSGAEAEQHHKQKQRLAQVQLIQGNAQQKNELNNLLIEQSLVEHYVDKAQPKNINYKQNQIIQKVQNFQNKINEQQNSFIQLLSESLSKLNQDDKKNTIYQDKKSRHQTNSEIVGEQTMKIIGMGKSTAKKIRSSQLIKQNSQYQLSINFNLGKKQSPSVLESCSSQKQIQLVAPKKKIKQKISYIRQFNDGKIKNDGKVKTEPNQLQQQNHLKQVDRMYQQNFAYKLYILIHRSVPHYSLARRQHKQYHVLVYTRIQQIIMFARYLKPEEKIVTIANEQSEKIYSSIIQKSGLDKNKLKVIFIRDLSQNNIRSQIDKILDQSCLKEINGKVATKPKNFMALVVYSSENERAQKAIKIVKKIFGIQIRILFLKEKQYQQMLSNSKFSLKVANNVIIYKIGLSKLKSNQLPIASIRGLFILAMHPDIKDFKFQYNHLLFSLESYLSRLIYEGNQKNLMVTQKTIKIGDSLRKKVQGMKSQTNLFKRHQNQLSSIRQNSEQRRISQNHRRSSIMKSSILMKSSPLMSIIASTQLSEYFTSRITFSNEEQLLSQIFLSYSTSKIVIAIITEKQYDTYQLLQSNNFAEVSKQIVWVIETKTDGKQVFISKNILFVSCDHIKQVVQGIIKQYQMNLIFDQLQIQSSLDTIKSQRFGQLKNKQRKLDSLKTLQVSVIPYLTKEQFKIFEQSSFTNKVILTISTEQKQKSKKFTKNILEFPSHQTIKNFCQILASKFKAKIKGQRVISPNFGTLLLVPNSNLQKVLKMTEVAKKVIIVKGYDIQNLSTIVIFSALKMLILVDKQTDFRCLRKCNFALQADKNLQKLSKIIGTII